MGEREWIGSGNVREPGLELGMPEAQQRYLSTRFPRGCHHRQQFLISNLAFKLNLINQRANQILLLKLFVSYYLLDYFILISYNAFCFISIYNISILSENYYF